MLLLKKEKLDRLVFQPEIQFWYSVNKDRGNLPKKYKDKSMLKVYDDLNASIRYYDFFLKYKYKNVKWSTQKEGFITTTIIETPIGRLTSKTKETKEAHSSSHIEYFIKNIEDIKVMEYALAHRTIEFDYERYEKAKEELGERTVIQFFYDRAPLQRLIINYMGFENTIYALHDYTERMEKFLKFMDEDDNKLYEVLVNSPVKILNFGDNIDANLDSPSIYEKYLIPYYKKKVEQLHKSGKYCHIHMDGSLKALLPYLKKNEPSFDGIEAATPLPQGDITLEELKEALGDTILLDGIPAILFLPSYSYKELEEFTFKLLELFSPNIIVGISDELPPAGDIEKVKFVSEIVNNYKV